MLRSDGLEPRVEPAPAFASFAYPYAALTAVSLATSLLPRSARTLRAVLGTTVAALMAAEDGLVFTPLSDRLARRRTHNVLAFIEPRDRAERTVCLVAHM